MRGSRLADRATSDVSVEHEIARLRDLNLIGLRARWQSMMGSKAPQHVSRQLLFAIITYRLQTDAFGDLDADTVRLLKKVGLAQSDAEVVPLTDAFDQKRRVLLPGTILTREWNGQIHRVMAVQDGFAWEGNTYDSLSKVALSITGTKWNGPRFFGLRDKKPAAVKE
jgi:hypothetical protein